MHFVKWSLASLILLAITAVAVIYFVLRASLPQISGEITNSKIKSRVSIERDYLGTAVVSAETIDDSAFGLGYAHAQDRLFQMDLLRRNAAGELSELFGALALETDKSRRFHQFRARAKQIVASLPAQQKQLLDAYSAGVNSAAKQHVTRTFEYWLTGTHFKPWLPEDTILATFTMYLDLQESQVKRDFNFTGIEKYAGADVLAFFTQASPFQATMDFSLDITSEIPIPSAPKTTADQANVNIDPPPKDIGSNNWVVKGELTKNKQGALLANDMHLGLAVPALWYRAQLNYTFDGNEVSVTGVSLPGSPMVVVGATDYVAWGFTNSNVDNVDWIALSDDTNIHQVTEVIKVKGKSDYQLSIPVSQFGPVKYLNGEPYALTWVAHQKYAVNLSLSYLAHQRSTNELLDAAKSIRIPVQNLVVADNKGNVAWQLTGAITSRATPSTTAITEDVFDKAWITPEQSPAKLINPAHGRIWSANARMVPANELVRYGNGGYALGARQKQIADVLMATSEFDEQVFYDLQLDNRALFLSDWHQLLIAELKTSPIVFEEDIRHLENWQACACPESVGYSLVRRFRSELINQLLQPVQLAIPDDNISVNSLWRSLEPAIWQLLGDKPPDWLPAQYATYNRFITDTYLTTRDKLFEQYADGEQDFEKLRWGNVNKLQVNHPLAASLGPLKQVLNMPEALGFGDSYMPSVQQSRFGASQRFFVQPGNLQNAILTLPGGQSMHPLSKFYERGFTDYVNNENTPLLPTAIEHQLVIYPSN